MNDEWKTPEDFLAFFKGWDDPALPGRTDGLVREWGDPTYCNPPYSNPKPCRLSPFACVTPAGIAEYLEERAIQLDRSDG